MLLSIVKCFFEIKRLLSTTPLSAPLPIDRSSQSEILNVVGRSGGSSIAKIEIFSSSLTPTVAPGTMAACNAYIPPTKTLSFDFRCHPSSLNSIAIWPFFRCESVMETVSPLPLPTLNLLME